MTPKPWENSAGYHDPTAYAAEKAISKEEQRVSDLVGCIKYIARLAGFEIVNRIEFQDIKSRRTYR